MDENKDTSSTIIEHPAQLLLVAIWFGLLIGFAEVCLLGAIKFLFHRFLYLSLDAVWMAPLVNVVLFGMIGLALCLAARRWPPVVSLRTAIFIFSFLSFVSVLLMYPRIHLYAVLLLAAGLAMQAARVIAAHSMGFYTIVRRTFGWILVVIAALAASIHGSRQFAEYRALAKLPPASPQAPNVLLIVLDTVRAQSLSMYGYARPTTPQLDLFRKGGVLFERAISTAPWTLPSHAGMFTGRYPYELSLDWVTPLGASFPTLADVLGEHGYATAGFIANSLYCTWESGLGRSFIHYEDFLISPGEIVRSSSLGRSVTNNSWLREVTGYHEILGRKSAARVNRDFLRWLSRNDQRPFFVFLNYFDAHTPYLPPEPFASKFRSQKRQLAPWNGDSRKWLPEEVRGEQDAYDGAIAYLDHHLGQLFDELRKRGLLENTLVIVTSDHGEEFHEHGFMSHSNSLYLPALHVPLLMVFPGRVPAGGTVVEPVSLRDLPSTVLDLLQLDSRVRFPGETLTGYWNGKQQLSSRVKAPLLSEGNGYSDLPDWYPASKGDMKSLLADPYHYIKNGDGREELYDVAQDPLEQRDLSQSEEGRRSLERFRGTMANILNGYRSR